MEELRMLSNLETAKHKLLHIILVGQPELKEKLESHELRQLRQRISLNCRLIPLGFKDVRHYIQHRINVASGKPIIQFADAAYRDIYNYSKGIPRLINIVCDRALLTAFGLDQMEITQKIVRSSIKELTDENDISKNNFKKQKKTILFFYILSLIFLLAIYYFPGLVKVKTIVNSPKTTKLDPLHLNNEKKPVPDATASDAKRSVPVVTTTVKKKSVPDVTVSESKKVVSAVIIPDAKRPAHAVTFPVKKQPVPDATVSEAKNVGVQKNKPPKVVMEPATEPVRSLGNLLETMNRLPSRQMAIKVALNLWNIEPEIKPEMDTIDDDQDFFRLVSKNYNLLIRRIDGNLNAIKKLNLPAILAVHLNKDILPLYFTIIKIDAQNVTLRGGKQDISIELSPVELESYWSGVAYIPWKNFLSLSGTIPIDSPENSITTLNMLLRDIGFKEVEITPFYDDKTRQAVKYIQRKYGLHIDGTVGSTTKIALYNEKKVFKRPYIVNAVNSFVR